MAVGVGIDIGSSTARVARIARRRGAIAWAGAVAASVQADDLAAKLRESRIRTRRGVAGLSGSSTIIRYARVPLVPAWKLRMLVTYEATQGGELDASFDYRLLNLPAKVESNELTVLTAVSKNDALNERLGYLASRGIRGIDFAPDALALYEAFSQCPEASEALDQFCLVLDIGASKTEMVIAYNGGLIFARSISFGGADFTKTLAAALGIPEDRAERLKVKQGAILDEHEIEAHPAAERPLLSALLAAAEEFFGAIRASLMFAKAQTKIIHLDIGRVYLSGHGARLRGLPEFLVGKLGVRASFFRPPDEWGVPGDQGQPSEWMIAAGLALLSLRPPGQRLSILPPAARKRRRFWQHDVFSYAACVVFAAAAAVGTVAHVHNWSAARKARVARSALMQTAREREAALADLVDGNNLRREQLELFAAAAAAGARVVEFLNIAREAQGGPVILSRLRVDPGDLNRLDDRSYVTLVGTVGQSTKPQHDVLKDFCKSLTARLTAAGHYAPPDDPNFQLIERARLLPGGHLMEFQLRVPLRPRPEKEKPG